MNKMMIVGVVAMMMLALAHAQTCDSPFGTQPQSGGGPDNSLLWTYIQTGKPSTHAGDDYVAGVPPADWYTYDFDPAADNTNNRAGHDVYQWTQAQGSFGQNLFCDSISPYIGADPSVKNGGDDKWVNRPAHTEWFRKTDLYLRGFFNAPKQGFSNGKLLIVVDNQLLKMYINGQELSLNAQQQSLYNSRSGCGVAGVNNAATVNAIIEVDIPAQILRDDGKNLIAIQARDISNGDNTEPWTSEGDQAFFDLSVSYNTFITDGQDGGSFSTPGTCICLQGTA